MRPTLHSRPRAGNALLFTVVAMTALLGVASLAFDYGRVRLAQSQLQDAADAAARAGAVSALTSQSQATTDAKTVAADNTVDGTPLVLQSADVKVGQWTSGSFTTSGSPYNAVQVTAYRAASRGTAVPLIFASLLGRSGCDVNATATAYATNAININASVPATSNPWLAGMPSGTLANVGNPHNNPDKAPAESPVLVTGVTLVAGMSLNFASISGNGTNDPKIKMSGPDGDPNNIVQNFKGAENGMSSLAAPINSLVAVFLDDSQPSLTAAPAMLDFSSTSSRNFTTLSPQLKQPFFIGDGKNDSGVTQQFIVPAGATRLFLCSMDGYEWNNNSGGRVVQATQPAAVTLVR